MAIYHDDAIDHGLVERLGAAHIPLIAVLSGDPRRPYRNGGITYDYDPDNLVYVGHSAGRSDNFKYKASPFARLRSLPLHYCNMHTVLAVGTERIVCFDDKPVDQKPFDPPV